MKRLLLLLLVIGLAACSQPSSNLSTDEAKASYAIGMDMAKNLANQSLKLDAEAFYMGMKDIQEGKEPRLKEEEIMAAFKKLQEAAIAKQMEEMEKQKKDNDAFFVEFAKTPGTQKTASGIHYRSLKSGNGKSPKPANNIEVHYKGTLTNNTEFDSSYKRNEPAKFKLGNVIPGWVEILQQMKEGDKWLVAIPPDLAYGEQGAPPVIPGNSVLIFEIELLKVL